MEVDEELSRYVIEKLEGLEEGVREGSGSFGSVYQVRINGMPCIAKRLHDILSSRQVAVPGAPEGSTIRERFRRECLLLSRLRHPNIVQFLGVHYGADSSDLTLVFEHMHLDLEQCLATYPRMPLSIKLGVLKDVSYGLLHLHTRKPPIVHRDLTASNILVTPDMRAKIADLGVSRILDVSPMQLSTVTACPGTLAYMPPEALRPDPVYDVRLDYFSFGVLALFTAIQKFPHVYYGLDIPESIQKEGKSELYKRHTAMEALTSGHCLYELIVQCLIDDPDKRPTAWEINRTMKELCLNLPKRFPSVLEMHGEIWKLHGERERLARTLEKQPPVAGETDQEHYVRQIEALTEENTLLRRKSVEVEERIREFELAQNDLTPLQPVRPDDSDDLCPLPHGPTHTRSPRRHRGYVNLVPTTTSENPLDTTTPTNAPHLPTSDSSRYIDQHSPCLPEQINPDFHDFPANGHFSGPPSNMSCASTGSQPGSAPAYDPNLQCHGCSKQFREGEIQVFRQHSATCEKLRALRHHSPPTTDDYYCSEVIDPEEQDPDPNLTCVGCRTGFRERQIQEYRKHCRTCPKFINRVRSKSQHSGSGDRKDRDDDSRDRSNTLV